MCFMAKPKQKMIRISRVEIFHKAKSLLEAEMGPVPDTMVITSALNWLIAARSQKLIPADQVLQTLRETAAQSVINALEVLSEADLIEAGDYEVHVNQDTGAARLVRNGEPVNAKPKAVNVDELMEKFIPESATREKTVN